MITHAEDDRSDEACRKAKLPKSGIWYIPFWLYVEQVYSCHHVFDGELSHN